MTVQDYCNQNPEKIFAMTLKEFQNGDVKLLVYVCNGPAEQWSCRSREVSQIMKDAVAIKAAGPCAAVDEAYRNMVPDLLPDAHQAGVDQYESLEDMGARSNVRQQPSTLCLGPAPQ